MFRPPRPWACRTECPRDQPSLKGPKCGLSADPKATAQAERSTLPCTQQPQASYTGETSRASSGQDRGAVDGAPGQEGRWGPRRDPGWSPLLRPLPCAQGCSGHRALQLCGAGGGGAGRAMRSVRPRTSCGPHLIVNPPGSQPLPARVGVGVKGQLGRPLRDPLGRWGC